MTKRGACALLVAGVVSLVALSCSGVWPATPSVAGAAPSPAAAKSGTGAPVFAYYYLWFDRPSWDRAKTDVPALGKYSSDDPKVMRQHIRWAKQAGITGFIVSWKHSATNDRRLLTLIDVAASEHFSLAMIYQGLDFYKRPLPATRVAQFTLRVPPRRHTQQSLSAGGRASVGGCRCVSSRGLPTRARSGSCSTATSMPSNPRRGTNRFSSCRTGRT